MINKKINLFSIYYQLVLLLIKIFVLKFINKKVFLILILAFFRYLNDI